MPDTTTTINRDQRDQRDGYEVIRNHLALVQNPLIFETNWGNELALPYS